MVTLAIETSHNVGSIALVTTDRLVERTWEKRASHSEVIISKIIECLDEAGVQLADINGLLVGVGPGSFTGIRVGLNTAKTLAYTLNIPVKGYDSVELICRQQSHVGAVTAISYGFRDIVYTCSWNLPSKDKTENSAHQQIRPTEATQFEKISIAKNSLVVGNAHKFFEFPTEFNFHENKNQNLDLPQARYAIDLFAYDLGPKDTWEKLRAKYVRDSEPEEKRKTSPASS